MSGYWYLATPYSKYPTGLQSAFAAACDLTARLLEVGVPVFCPIAHSHPVATIGGLDPLDHEIWLPADRPLMDAACGCIVGCLDGWEDSVGVQHEIDIFRAAGKPVLAYVPGDAAGVAHEIALLELLSIP